MIPGAFQVSFVSMDAVEAARVEVRGWLTRLGPLIAGMKSGHVLIQAIEERRQERRYHVRMDLTMPDGGVVMVTLEHPSNLAHEDLYVAIRNAFRAARRQLEDYHLAHPAAPPPPQGALEGPLRGPQGASEGPLRDPLGVA